MSKNRFMLAISVLVLATLILAACAPVTPAVVEVEKIVTQEVEVKVPSAFATAPFALGDLKVRQALSYCTNRVDLIKAVYPLLSEEQQAGLIMATFIPKSHWAYAGDENVTIYPYDVEQGKALLEEAGWTVAEDSEYRANADGIELALKFTTTAAVFRQTWAAVWEAQMKECGVRIIRLHAPASWWFGDTTGIARRDYELGAFAWVGQADPGGQTLYACDQIPGPENGWVGQNAMGWCNELASTNIKKANNTLVKQERIDAYTIVQQEFTKDIPSIPLFNRTETFATAADITGFAPMPGQEYYNYNVYEWAKAGSDTVILGFSQEPASLFTLVEDAFVANIAYQIARPAQETHLNYEFKASLVKDLPTIENGGTTNNDVEVTTPADVEVKEGDMVVDADGKEVALAAGVKVINAAGETVEYTSGTVMMKSTEKTMVVDADGNVVALAVGVKVINAAGETVEFTGEPIMMKQMVSKFEIIDGLTWEDGVAVSSADIELSKKIACDKESGATSFITCDKTASVEFLTDAVGYVHTWIPGVQDPLYYVPIWGLYPAHQVIGDGRTLADVPAKEWATLAEVAEKPLAYGPYKLVEWVKGEKMVFAANEFWVGTAPKSPNFVILFITAESAEGLLLSGEVDILASETLAGLSQTLKDAETAGTIVTYVEAGGTWEHIDIALFIR